MTKIMFEFIAIIIILLGMMLGLHCGFKRIATRLVVLVAAMFFSIIIGGLIANNIAPETKDLISRYLTWGVRGFTTTPEANQFRVAVVTSLFIALMVIGYVISRFVMKRFLFVNVFSVGQKILSAATGVVWGFFAAICIYYVLLAYGLTTAGPVFGPITKAISDLSNLGVSSG